MEVKPKMPVLASHFWPKFIRKSVALAVLVQISVTLIAITVLTLASIININSIDVWITFGIISIVGIVFNVLLMLVLIKPTKQLLAAIIHVSDEKPEIKLSNPNDKSNKKTGLSDALNIIYNLSSTQKDTTDTTKNDIKSSILDSGLDNTKCGFVIMDSDHNIIYANRAAPIKIDTSGQKSLELLFNDDNTLEKWLDECKEQSVHNEHIWSRIPDRLPNQEDRRFFDVMASYNKGSKGETVIALVDRTDVYSVDEESLDFIAFAAHELRGPITVIRGYLDVLNDELEDVLQDDQHELFRRLIVSSNRLSGYISNILNTSRYDRRHLKVHLIEDSISAIYDVISDDMKMRASSQNRLLTVEIPKDLPTIAADRASISEVFGNLIDNAIKYSNEGGVINVSAKTSGDFVDFIVEDHGIGMPESVVSQLFQKFYRSHRSRETVAGTGIGLYISKAIVESHGGTISVRSEDGRGSTFIASLPIYSTVADKLHSGDNSNEGLINEGRGWIKNHSMYRG